MHRHQLSVRFDLPAQVGPKDVVFVVTRGRRSQRKLGELRVSQGAVVWYGRKDKQGRKLSWQRFDELMNENARRQETRPHKAPAAVRRRRLRR